MLTQVMVKGIGEFGVSVVNHIPLVQEETIKRIGELPGTLPHERLARMGRHPRKMDASCTQFYHHENVVGDEPVPGDHADCEEARGGQHVPVHREKL